MTSSTVPPTPLTPELRARLLAAPEVLLEDEDLMHALITARDAQVGDNVIDIRGRWMAQLETRLDALEQTHRGVLAAAYDNVAGTRQIHRAVLALMEPRDAGGLLGLLSGRLMDILQLDALELMIEAPLPAGWPPQGAWLRELPQGGVAAVLATRRAREDGVTLRRVAPEEEGLIRSEALLPLNLPGQAALLVLGSTDPACFAPPQGTDLLHFLQAAIERQIARVM